MVWLRKAKSVLFSHYVSAVLLISANNLDFFMALEAVMIYFYETLCMIVSNFWVRV